MIKQDFRLFYTVAFATKPETVRDLMEWLFEKGLIFDYMKKNIKMGFR